MIAVCTVRVHISESGAHKKRPKKIFAILYFPNECCFISQRERERERESNNINTIMNLLIEFDFDSYDCHDQHQHHHR